MNVKILNENPVISDLTPLTYSMIINKNTKQKNIVLNLEELVKNFPLDIKLDNNTVTRTKVPGFISKSYYQVQKLSEKKDEFSYSYPPKGPIETGFTCIYCEKNGPNYHSENCHRPFTSSLVLSKETIRFPGATEGTSYSLIVKKSGQKKVASKRTRSQVFTDNLELFYEYTNESKCVIRISKNGSINIVSANFNDNDLTNILFNKINKVPNAIIQKPYTIESSYKYMITGQFNIFPQNFNDKLIINLNILNNNLWETPLFKKKMNGKNVFILENNYFYVNKYVYNSGELFSKSNKITNPFILFTLIHPNNENIKHSVMVYLRGSVQIKTSYVDEPSSELSLRTVYLFLKNLFYEIIVYSTEANYPIIKEDIKTPKKSKIKNTIDGKQPQVCHNRPGTKAGSGDFRPVPYSFYGVCPMEGYYNIPGGVKRPDGKYEPCCAKLKQSGDDSMEKYVNILLNGYKVPQPDNEGIVYIPGTKIIEPRGFPGLNNMSKKQIIDFLEEAGYIGNKTIFNNDIDKNTIIDNLSMFESSKKKITLTYSTFPKLTNCPYIVTPINNNTIYVTLFFDKNGNGYFININYDVSEGPKIPELSNTIIEGYLNPLDEIVFYPYDIVYYKNKHLDMDFYSSTSKENRYSYLNKSVELIKNEINTELNFDLNIVNGSKYYLEESNSLLFIPYNKKEYILKWSDVLYETNYISLNVTYLNKNRWIISLANKKIPFSLLQQGPENDIEIPVSFSKRFLNEPGIVLFKINIKRTDFKIDQRKPFTPISILDEHINNYTDVINILESINNPIPKTVFTNITTPPGFVLNDHTYFFKGVNEPLEFI